MYELLQLEKGCLRQSDSMIISIIFASVRVCVCELLAHSYYKGKPSACCFNVKFGNVLLENLYIVEIYFQ